MSIAATRPCERFAAACVCATVLALARTAQARRLVERGDLLVTAGDAVYAVRADGGGVEAFSPRPGSGANLLEAPTGVVVDPLTARVFVGTDSGALFAIDPDDGSQTQVTRLFGGALELPAAISAVEAIDDGSLLVAGSSFVDTFTIDYYSADLFVVSAPEPDGTALSDRVGPEPSSGLPTPPSYGLAADAVSSDIVILLSSRSVIGSSLATVDPSTGGRVGVAGVPVQIGAFVSDAALDCSAGLASLCTRYWIEGRIFSGNCDAAAAAVFREGFLSPRKKVFSGPPLRCPVAIQAGVAGTLFVLDAAVDTTSLHLYRLDRDAALDEYTAVLIAGEAELPESNPVTSRLALSPLALPEAQGAEFVAALLAALRWRYRRAARRHADPRPPRWSAPTPTGVDA